jgi:hypothetical protein
MIRERCLRSVKKFSLRKVGLPKHVKYLHFRNVDLLTTPLFEQRQANVYTSNYSAFNLSVNSVCAIEISNIELSCLITNCFI